MYKLIRLILCVSMCTPLLMAQLEDRESQCGFRKVSRTPKIINGHDAFHGQFPWVISLRLHRRHHCGGALINNNWVLTAAHCVAQISARAFTVKLGGHYRNPDHEPTSIELNVNKVVPHEGFSFTSFANDIALIKLAKSVDYSDYVWPICLPQTDSVDYANKTGVVIGWGKVTPNGLSATSLQQVELPIIDNPKCIKWYESQGKIIPIRSSQFCAGLEEGGKDACQGDSGSPMMKLDDQSGQAMAIGIVSAGIGCALPKLPGLYTRIAAYIPWIKKQLDVPSPTEKPIPTTQKPTTVTQKPSTVSHKPSPVTHKPNTSLPIWTIPANNHVIVVNFPIHINHTGQITAQIIPQKVTFSPHHSTSTSTPTSSSTTTTTSPTTTSTTPTPTTSTSPHTTTTTTTTTTTIASTEGMTSTANQTKTE